MKSEWLFILTGVGSVFLLLLYRVGGPKAIYDYLGERKDVLKGIAIVVIGSILFALVAKQVSAGEWLDYTEVYAGLDQTFKVSPQCESDSFDDKTTSNVGIRQHVYRSDDGLYNFHMKYQHHSCALNGDRNAYDALGIEFSYRIDW